MIRQLSNIFIIFFFSVFTSSCALTRLLNSGTTHVKYTDSETKIDDVTYKNEEKFGDLSFSIRNVQHPSKYRPWAFNFGLTPSIHYDSERYGAVSGPGFSHSDLDELPQIKIRRLLTFANAKFTLHSPVGAFALTGGAGLGLAERRENGDYVNMSTRHITRVDFVWVGFFAKRFYLMAGPRYYKEDYEQWVFAFRLGFYWGDVGRF